MVCQRRLPDLPPGAKARIHSLECRGPERARLCSMGLTPGAEVEIRQDDHGACRVLVRDCSIILVDELARHIICEIGHDIPDKRDLGERGNTPRCADDVLKRYPCPEAAF